MANDFIFLLGAGASANAELPTAFQMTQKFVTVVQETNDEYLVRALAFVLGGIHMHHGQRGQIPQSNVNVEELATMLEVMRSRHIHQIAPFVGAWHELLGQFDGSRDNQRDLLKELNDLLQTKITAWLETPPIGKIRYLEPLRDFARDYGDLDVFTLNYDLCVETTLTNCQVPFTCGFTSQGWDADQFGISDFKVRLYKLHGSLDWYQDEEDQMIYSAQQPPEDRVPAAGYRPLLIFGIPNKLQPVDPFLHLSYTFSEKVKKAKVIVVVGYGFGDDYINRMIHQGLSRDSRKRMIVVGFRIQDTQDTFRQQFDCTGILMDARRVDFLEGGTAKVLQDGLLLDGLKKAIAEATEEGPF